MWSSDGKKLYFRSDRDGTTGLYEMDMATQKAKSIWNRSEEVKQLHMSPDGKMIGFWAVGAERGLFTLSLENNQIQKVVSIPADHSTWQDGGDISWSPDMRWMSYTFCESNDAWNIWIIPTTGGKAVNVTRLNAYHSMPKWSPDGKYLFFQSDREADGNRGSLYVLPLVKEPAPVAEIDIKFEKPKDPVKVDIDFDDITRRIRKLASQNPEADLAITSEGKLMFVSDGDVWSVTYDGKETKRLTNGGGFSNFRLSKDGTKGYVLRNGDLMTMTISDDSKQEKVDFTADWDHDVRADRKAAFIQFWRTYNEGFYDPDFHGRDWTAIRTRYEPLLDAVETREEFSTLLNMMVGELEASHSEVGAAPGDIRSPETPHLGFTFDYSYEGIGLKVDKVPAGAPGSYDQTRINPGDYILAIDDVAVTLDEYLYKLINNKQGRLFTFLVNSQPTREGARTVKYASMGWWDFWNINYRNRDDKSRKYVEETSSGKIGYVHINGMGGANQTKFEREMYEY